MFHANGVKRRSGAAALAGVRTALLQRCSSRVNNGKAATKDGDNARVERCGGGGGGSAAAYEYEGPSFPQEQTGRRSRSGSSSSRRLSREERAAFPRGTNGLAPRRRAAHDDAAGSQRAACGVARSGNGALAALQGHGGAACTACTAAAHRLGAGQVSRAGVPRG